MKKMDKIKKVKYLRVLFVVLMIVFASVWVLKHKEAIVPTKKPAEKPVAQPVELPPEKPPETPKKPPEPPKVTWKASTFSALPGWQSANLETSLKTFKVSCDVFLRQPENKKVGSAFFSLKASDWYPACRGANFDDRRKRL